MKHDPEAACLEFLRRGVQLYPELIGRKPVGPMNKVNPTISEGIVVDITFSPVRAACRLLSRKPELLQPLLQDRDAFEREVGKPLEPWDQIKPTEKHYGVTVLPGSVEAQSGWSLDELVRGQLELYGRIKKFVRLRI